MSEETVANSDVVTKYKVAGDIANKALAAVKAKAVAGAKIIDLCAIGDAVIVEETGKVFNNKKSLTKGIAFPTTVSTNDAVAHFSPIASESNADVTLQAGDVVKISVGAHIDGYPSILGETIVVEGGEANEAVANAIAAAYYATEAALRTVKVGNKNWDVTRIVDQVAKEFGAVPLEGMLSQQHLKDTIDGKKKIILNPSEQQRKEFEAVTFAENEVYGLDILLTTEGASAKTAAKQTPTTLFKKASRTYQLKLKTSRAAISEIQKKAGTFPFNISILEDQRRARMALQEPLNHGLVDALEVTYSKQGTPVVSLFTTFALTKNGILKLAAAPVEAPVSSRKIEDPSLLELLEQPLKVTKPKAPKA